MPERNGAAFFDLDKTVIARASMVAMGRPLYRHGLISRWLLLRALWGQLVYLWVGAGEEKLTRMRDSVLRLTAGWEQEAVSRIARDAIEEVIEPIVYDEALALITEHQAAGRLVFIVSASPEEIVAPLAEHLGVDRWIATRPEVAEGRYTGKVAFYAYGPHKATAMQEVAAREGIDLNASFAYSDSATDEPMLASVGHPVAVNPDRELLRVARLREWEVRYFVRPVRLRDRLSPPPPAPTVAVGGGLVAASAAGVTWWFLRRATATPPPPPSLVQAGLSRGLRPRTPSLWGRALARPARLRFAQAARTFLAATAPRAMRTMRSSSRFMRRG